MQMLAQKTIVLTNMEDMLFLPSNPTEKHSLHEWLSLVLCHLSGNNWKAEVFRQRLQKSLRSPGDLAPKNSTQATCQDGNYIVVKGTLNPFALL